MSRVAIIGAGLSGLVAGIVLAQRAVDVAIYEQADELGEVGAGISLAPNASRVLEAIGLGPALERLADEPWANQTFHYRSMDLLVDIRRESARDEFGAPYLQMHRADLHGLLVDHLRSLSSDAIKLGHRLQVVRKREKGPRLIFAHGSAVDADVVVGADGVHSTVRNRLFEDDPPTFLGQVAYRGLVSRDHLDGDWPEDRSRNLVGPGAIFLTYPVRRGKVINFVGLKRTDDWVDEGWSTTASRAEVMAAFAGFHPSVLEIIAKSEEADLYKWGLFGRAPLNAYVVGRTALVGDAAHPMLPFLGMGAAMAIEDGAVIGRCLSEIDDPDIALARYDALRGDRTRLVQAASRKAGESLQGIDPNRIRQGKITNEDRLGLFAYDAMRLAL